MANGSGRITDGITLLSGGVNSNVLPTYQSQALPEGLPRNMVAWAGNCTFRDGGGSQRPGFQPLVQSINWPGIFQGAHIYEPLGGDPYIITVIGGRIYQIRVDTDNSVHDITGSSGGLNTAQTQCWFVQGEQFMVIQDSVSVPLVWDGTTLRKITAMGGVGPYLPTGTAMAYYMGRIWVASGNGREYMAGDIVGGPSGTATYNLKDSILHSSENAYLSGGGKFTVPTNAGNIRALAFSAELDTALGQGRLYVFTRNSIYAINVPINRDAWILFGANTLPLQTVAQIRFGSTSDRGVVAVNGDLWYPTLEPGVRSLTLAIRYFQQWSNVQLSSPEIRVFNLTDRALLRYANGVLFNNWLIMSALPEQRDLGVIHKAMVVLDYQPISTLQEKKPPAWNGVWEGLDYLQLLEADFGGRQRAFAMVLSQVSNKIEVWEITEKGTRDNGDNRIDSFVEYGGFFSQSPLDLKELESGELWLDNLQGTVQIQIEYRADGDCWRIWHKWRECTARNSIESGDDASYPTQDFCPSYVAMRSLPHPPVVCEPAMIRPSNIGYTFQVRVTLKGTARIRGMFLYALPRQKKPFENLAPC